MIALRYHDQTKHRFDRFARSLGYLDWATQPDPFRRYSGAPVLHLPRVRRTGAAPDAAGAWASHTTPYAALFDGTVTPAPLDTATLGEFLRCSMGLSAWKAYGRTRWALRVNPSSGNLHPTEAYLLHDARLSHYAPREHALEERCVIDAGRWRDAVGAPAKTFFVGLTSVLWREAWKYGERAFRYCQHDTGHALGAMRLAAALMGWRLALLPGCADRDVARLLGLDRDEDFVDAEREEPECLAVVGAGDLSDWLDRDITGLAEAASGGAWRGRANRLSASSVAWPILDEVAEATASAGRAWEGSGPMPRGPAGAPLVGAEPPARTTARQTLLARRSATAFDGEGTLDRERFLSMLRRLRPPLPPWDALHWPPQVHLVLFIHRVEGLSPGVYAYLRSDEVRSAWRAAMRQEFLWEPCADDLFLLVPADVRSTAMRLSCDQDIAADGFCSLAMIARVESSLRDWGESFYRRLFWECGLIGQVLYLEAEAAGARGTGIGCFYDDPVHELLGLSGLEWQSLYHFAIGVPVEDARLLTEPGYPWEAEPR